MGQASSTEASRLALVADDDCVTRQYLVAAVTALGWTAEQAADGDAALARAGTAPRPSACVFDLGMPGPGGEALARALRATLPHARIVALSGDLTAAQRRALLRAGCDGAEQKPISIPHLARMLDGAEQASCSATRTLGNDPTPVLDDQAALQALGDPEIARDLRTLLAQQLDGELRALEVLVGAQDVAGIIAATHRLRAACRLCGAASLELSLTQLERAADRADRCAALDAALTAAQRFLAALGRETAGHGDIA